MLFSCKKSCSKKHEDYFEEHMVLQLNAQELALDEKALKEIMSAQKEGGSNNTNTAADGEQKKKKKKNKKKKKQTVEESKGTDDEDSGDEDEGKAKNADIPEEDETGESDWM